MEEEIRRLTTQAEILARGDGRWRFDGFRFHLKFLDGNLDLEEES